MKIWAEIGNAAQYEMGVNRLFILRVEESIVTV